MSRSLRRIARTKPTVADFEYWVFLPKPELPPQEEVMKVLFGAAALTPAEHLLSSDIRLHVALVLRERNPSAFRPDVLGDGAERLMGMLAECHAFARVRFLAEKLGGERRHLIYLPYLAYAYGKLGGGMVVSDRGTMTVKSLEEFGSSLKSEPRPAGSSFHVRTSWRDQAEGGTVETMGMVKIGLPELTSPRVETDERVLVTSLVEAYVEAIWDSSTLPETTMIDLYGDQFEVVPLPPENGRRVPLRLRRMRHLTD